MPPVAPSPAHHAGHADTLSVVVTEHWLDEFCEHVGSLCSVLQSLSKVERDRGPQNLISHAFEQCATLQDLLNAIPVCGRYSTPAPPAMNSAPAVERARPAPEHFPKPDPALDSDTFADLLGDNFPELGADDEEELPAVDGDDLHERCQDDVAHMLKLLQKFRSRAEGDFRELELLSVGHDWTRLSRLAGALKDAAGQVSAYRIVVDAAALAGAARIGCRNDVDLALDALRSDLRACTKQMDSWLSQGTVC